MNNEFNLNTRTLIVSFVFALMIMVPLRFIEVKNEVSKPIVLGESVELRDNCLDNSYVDIVISLLNDDGEIASFESRRCR
ncbi:hypothetical protein CO009_00115 [Candidatus Shapirobacteria bacterium CG_4_8_14_3_um_filter_35_11]|uniref:Uncharacterized protein n=6 Tax=Candidatus Shapironibacteriota TaxID=1752721 RepID=A0A1J5HRN3_9BACT|nr:MAG: hypothetical protein AUK05_02135 [Candidatus Shapirobacteria bacterium CG2_30_35_20]PIV07635.1 MAG: hypothetical protein COS53_01340 [Candidatus Shapirobacteria bacterium CG03_land_8_20_14_0_80_35_14]PIX68332.1 MAG: hypothetical protein COZ41_00260 [Candidatus Shapirobacteria bacterium CG_4_10_14_3_um_filter_35_13]PJA51178.1 MAG: hypothetical protein CO168_01195 [Candidatus Shapirobacteria bacterium CG_4_9_14_3_um_filter_36_12]PJC81159.1 MAG: hypothetical protein CO009_00115 [Candidatus